MRKQSRPAAVLLAALAATTFTLSSTLGLAAARADGDDRTDSAAYTQARQDYWAARAAYDARRAADAAAADPSAAPADGPAPAPTAAAAPSPAATAPAPAPRAASLVPSDSQLAALRMCESTDNYSISSGNGYYGAYQFSAVTWWWLGYSGYPNQASPAVQDEAVRALYAIFGWSPWPSCSRVLGFA